MSTVLMIEPHCEGHHMHYVRWIAGEAATCGHEVTLATSGSCFDHPLYEQVLRETGGRVRGFRLPSWDEKPEPKNTLELIRQDIRYYRAFAACYARLSQDRPPDYVFLPYDYCLYAASVVGSPFGRTPWGGLVLRPTFHLREMGLGAPGSPLQKLKAALFFRLLRKNRTLRALYTFDETLLRYVSRRGQKTRARLRFLPEPVELRSVHSRESARRMFGIPQDAVVVLAYGVLDHSKGIDTLLAAATAPGFSRKVCLLLAGPQKDEIRGLLGSEKARRLREQGRFYVQDRFLYGGDEDAVFRASDVVWVGYRGQHVSSGVLLQAAMAGLPVVACDEGIIAWMTKSHEIGFTVDVANPREAEVALTALVRDRSLSARFGENGRRLSARHRVDSFRTRVREDVLACLPSDSAS